MEIQEISDDFGGIKEYLGEFGGIPLKSRGIWRNLREI